MLVIEHNHDVVKTADYIIFGSQAVMRAAKWLQEHLKR